ncbi:MAG: hypothetical protein INQ03_03275 [Candidatus Heimdallarchaeota archaeon]|nr:hypothetical protein [Candidatus Heimdallarchaeota archaeon]
MKSQIQISILVIGSVLSLLEWFLADDPDFAASVLILTSLLTIATHLIVEWRYYKRHGAVIASSQFLILPGLAMVITDFFSLLGSLPYYETEGMLELEGNVIALFTIPYLILFTVMTHRYYNKRYTGFIVRRKIMGTITLPLIIHSTVTAIIVLIALVFQYIELFSLIFVIIYLYQVLSILVIPRFKKKETPGHDRERRAYMDAIGRTPTRRQSIPASSSTEPVRPSQRSDRRSIPTRPSGGYKSVPTQSRSQKPQPSSRTRQPTSRRTTATNSSQKPTNSKARSQTSSKETSRKPAATIGDGIELISQPKAVARREALDQKYIPSGNVIKEDLKCMVCYQDFSKSSKSIIILCPSCKYPAHEEELNQWLLASPQCPRCAKEIKKSINNKLRLNEKDYANLINKL